MSVIEDTESFTVRVRTKKGEITSFTFPEEMEQGGTINPVLSVKNISTDRMQFLLKLVNHDTAAVLDSYGPFYLSAGSGLNNIDDLSTIMGATDTNFDLELWGVVD